MLVVIGLVLTASMAQAQGTVEASYGHNAALTLAGEFGKVGGLNLDLFADFTPNLKTEADEDESGVSAGVRLGRRFGSTFGTGVGIGLGNTIDGRLKPGFGDNKLGLWDIQVQPFAKIYLDSKSGVIFRSDYRALSEGLKFPISFSVGVFTGW